MGRRSAGAAIEVSRVRTSAGGSDECDGGGGVVSSIFGRRRTTSAGRLLGLAPPPAASLNEALDQMTLATKHIMRAADAQRKAAAALESHVLGSNNAAVADVGGHQANLLRMEAECAERSAADRRRCLAELRKINEDEKSVRTAEQRLTALYEKETKIIDSLRKGPAGFLRRRSEDDSLRRRQQLEQVRMDIEKAKQHLDFLRSETEVVKMMRYRTGMQGLADSVMAYSGTSAAIYSCIREITELVPAISTQDVMTMNYDGAPITANCVSRLRRDLASTSISPASQLMGAARRRSNRHGGGGSGASGAASGGRYPEPPPPLPAGMMGCSGGASTPPPPYTPTAPTLAELPQPGGAATVACEAAPRPSPPRFAQIYPALPANPYRRSCHS